MNWYKQAKYNWQDVIKGFGISTITGLALWWGVSTLDLQNMFEKEPNKIIEKLEEIKSSEEEQIIDNNIIDNNVSNEVQNDYINAAKEMIIKHEDKNNSLYFVENIPHIGIGFNLNKEGAKEVLSNLGININEILNNTLSLTDEQVYNIFENDMKIAINDAMNFTPNFNEQPDMVKSIIIDMAFNLGYTRLSGFEKFKKALLNNDYNEAAKEMIDSKWYSQVGGRSKELVSLMQGV